MKKTVLVAIAISALSMSGFSIAKSNFAGFSVGAELSSTKHTFEISDTQIDAKSSNKASIGVFSQYGFEFAKDFVGIGEVKLRTGGSESNNQNGSVSKEKFNVGIAYLQGYRLTDNILPYVKIGGELSSFDFGEEVSRYTEGSSLFGIAYGVGVKFALTEEFEAGVEYTQTRLRNVESDIKAKVNKIAVNVGYRF